MKQLVVVGAIAIMGCAGAVNDGAPAPGALGDRHNPTAAGGAGGMVDGGSTVSAGSAGSGDSNDQRSTGDGPPPAPPTAVEDVAYRLRVSHHYGVPLSTATGVDCDGDHVWLVGGGHNASRHTVVHADLESGDIDRTFTFDNLIETAGTGVYGIGVWDGAILLAVSGNTNKIVRVDPVSGEVLRSYQAPTDLGPSDLAATGAFVVESTGTGNVYTLEGATGAVVSHFAAGDSGRDYGVALRGSEAFVGSLFGGMDAFELSTGAHLGRVTREDRTDIAEKDVGAMCFHGANLLILATEGLTEYELLPAAE